MHTNQLKDYEDELIVKRMDELHKDEVQTMAFFGWEMGEQEVMAIYGAGVSFCRIWEVIGKG